MLTVNQLDFFTLRTGAAAATGSIVLRHEPLKVLLVLHPVQSQMQVEQQMQITYPFRLNSILVKK
jgi:hypothetical protein